MNECLSISSQLCCTIKFLSLWVCVYSRPNCLIIENIYSSPTFKDITNNQYSGGVVVFVNSPKPYFCTSQGGPEGIYYLPFSQVSECDTVSIPSYHVMIYRWFSGWSLSWVSNEFWGECSIGSIRNSFSIPYLSCMIYIHRSLMQDHFQGVYDLRFSM